MRKDEICNEYITHKQDILDAIRNKLMRWHTPVHGYTSIEEYESDERYVFLMRSRQVVTDNLIHPEEVIVEDGTSEVVFVQNALFYQYWILKEKYKNGDNEWIL